MDCGVITSTVRSVRPICVAIAVDVVRAVSDSDYVEATPEGSSFLLVLSYFVVDWSRIIVLCCVKKVNLGSPAGDGLDLPRPSPLATEIFRECNPLKSLLKTSSESVIL
jgi:hypothetical protein